MEGVTLEGLVLPYDMVWLYLSVLRYYFSQPSSEVIFMGIDTLKMKGEIELVPNME